MSEDKGDVVFLRRIVPGGADKSYGVHVARIAGLPGAVVNRAWEVLRDLERGASEPRVEEDESAGKPGLGDGARPLQLPLLSTTHPAISGLLALDIASMTPLEAITALYELQKQAKAD